MTQVAVHPRASLNGTAWDLRWNTPKSSASIAKMNKAKPTHSQTELTMPHVPLAVEEIHPVIRT
jgi:hypothetical protein